MIEVVVKRMHSAFGWYSNQRVAGCFLYGNELAHKKERLSVHFEIRTKWTGNLSCIFILP